MFYELLIVAMLFGDVLWWRYVNRRLRRMQSHRTWRILLSLFMLLQMGCVLRILFFNLSAWHNGNVISVMGSAAAYMWHLFILPATLLTMGLAKAISAIISVARRRQSPDEVAVDPAAPTVSRREWLTGVALAAPPLLAGTGIATSFLELHKFRINRMRVVLADLPKELDGMTIAHVADTHIGRFTNNAMLNDVANAVNRLDADLMLFAGDLIDVSLEDLPVAIEFAKRLKGRFGSFFCQGNHDLIEDTFHDTEVFETMTRISGLPMLLDEQRTVRARGCPLQIIGGRWSRNPHDRAQKTAMLMPLVDPTLFSIFLTHHPHAWDGATTPLTLSGHTHGGQLMLSERVGAGPMMFRYWSGLYRRNNQALVVSNGVGNWFPLRINAPAEIIHLTLNRA